MEVLLAMQGINSLTRDVFFPKIQSILSPENPLGPRTEEDKAEVREFCNCAFKHPRSLHCTGEISKSEYHESKQKKRVTQKYCRYKTSVRGSQRDPEE